MPGPGVTGAVSGFMQGWMEGSARKRVENMQRAQGLMDIATKMANLIDDSDSPEERAVYHKTMMDSMNESEKLMKGGSEWGFITKLFGGKGKGDQMQDPHALLSGLGLDATPYGTQEKAMAVQSPGVATAIAPRPATTPAPNQETPGGVSSMLSQAQDANLGQPVKPVTMNVPMPRKTTPGAVAPEDVTGKGLERVQLGPDRYDLRIGGLSVAPRDYRAAVLRTAQADFEDQRSAARAEESAHMAMEHQKEWSTWQADQADRYNFSRADTWSKTGAAQQLQKRDPQLYQDTIQFMQFGVPIRDRNYQLKEVDKQDPLTGKRTRQMISIDARSGGIMAKIGDPEDLPDNPHDLQVKPFMTEGRNYAQAEQAWAKSEMSDNQMTMRLKQLQADRSEEMITAQQQLNKLRQQKLEGKADAGWAKQVLSIARPLAFQSGYVRDSGGMVTGWDINQSMAALIQIVQFYGGMEWSELQNLLGKSNTGTSTDEDNASWFLKQHQSQGQGSTPGVMGAIGGRGNPPPAGTPLKLPGKQQ